MRQNVSKIDYLPGWCVSHNVVNIGDLQKHYMISTKEEWYAHLKECAAGKECPFCQRLAKGPDWGGFDPLKELEKVEQSLHPKAKCVFGRWR